MGVCFFLCLLTACGKEEYILQDGRMLTDFKEEKINLDYLGALGEYEGYLDNVLLLEEKFSDKDYDEDGKNDRVLQYQIPYMEEGTGTQSNKKMYAICFGNGNVLEIGPFDDVYTGIELYTEDLTGDGKNEIIFYGEHMSTNPGSWGSEIAAWTIDGSTYNRLNLFSKAEDEAYVAGGYPFYAESADGEYMISIICPELNYIERYEIPDEWQEEFDAYHREEINKGNLELGESLRAWRVDFDLGKEKKALLLYIEVMWRPSIEVEVRLEWNGSEMEVVGTSIIQNK